MQIRQKYVNFDNEYEIHDDFHHSFIIQSLIQNIGALAFWTGSEASSCHLRDNFKNLHWLKVSQRMILQVLFQFTQCHASLSFC